MSTTDDRFLAPYTSGHSLQTLSDTGEVPDSIVKDARAALSEVALIVDANKTRLRRWAMLKGMFDGNPPYNPGSLRANGQAWRFNVATLEGKGLRSAGCAPYYDLFASGRYYAEVETSEGNPSERDAWSRIITEEWDVMLKAWREMHMKMNALVSDFVGYGRGFIGWEHPLDWRFRQWPHYTVLFPDGVEADLDSLSVFILRRKMNGPELLNKVRATHVQASAGWNESAVKAAVIAAQPINPTMSRGDYVGVQQMVNDGDAYQWARAATISVAHLFVREFNSKWSHYVVVDPDQGEPAPLRNGRGSAAPENPRYLYEKRDAYDSINEFIAPFVYEINDGTWNGASGLGKDIFAMMQAKDRMRCGQLDNIIMRQSILLQAQKASDRQKLALFQIGPVTVIPENCTPVPANLIGDIEATIAVNNDLNNLVQRNVGIYQPHLEKPQGNPRTATEATLDFQQSTILGGSAVNRFYAQLDPVYAEMYRRTVDEKVSGDDYASKAAKDFIKRCKDRGVPIEAIRKTRSVRAWRAVGNGSPFLRTQSLAQLSAIAPSLPEAGRVAWVQDYVASVSNYSTVNRYVPAPLDAVTTEDHRAYAMLENGIMKDGGVVLRTGTQNDLIHAETHLQGMAGALQSLEQGADPMTVLAFMDTAGAHTQQHLQALKGDQVREGDVKALEAMWKEMAKVTDKLKQQVLKQQQEQADAQQAAQPMLDPKTQAQIAIMQAELAMKREEHAADLQFEREKHQMEMAQMKQEMAMKEKESQQKLEIADKEAAASIERDSAVTEAKIKQGDELTDAKAEVAKKAPAAKGDSKSDDRSQRPINIRFIRDKKGRVERAESVDTVRFNRDKDGTMTGASTD